MIDSRNRALGIEFVPSVFIAVLRALIVTAGRAALLRSLPVYLTIMMVALIVFEGRNGLRAATLTQLASVNTPFRVGFWCTWLLVTTPAARAVLATPSTYFLRSLPIPWWQFLVVQGGFLALVESPWMALWLRGSGLLAGFAAYMASATMHCWIVSRPRRAIEWFAFLAVAVAIAVNASPILLGAIAIGIGPWALLWAWTRAPERGHVRDIPMVFGPAAVALSLAYFVTIARSHVALLGRSIFFTTVAIAITYMVVRNNRMDFGDPLVMLSASVFASAATIASASLAGPVLRVEREARWLLDTCGTSSVVREAAAAGTIVVWCIASGCIFTSGTAILLNLDMATIPCLLAAVLTTGASAGAMTIAAVRWTYRGDGRDAARSVLLITLVLSLTVLGVWVLYWYGIALCAVFAVASINRLRLTTWLQRAPARSITSRMTGCTLLQAVGIRKRLGNRVVLDAVNLTCARSEVVVITGENGAGKSTLLRILAGLIEPDDGTVCICDAPMGRGGLEARRELGYVPDATDSLPDLLVSEFIRLVAQLKGVPLGGWDTVDARLSHLPTALGLDRIWLQRMGTLSFGQRKRVCVLAALINDPALIVIDEPSNGLDADGVNWMVAFIGSRQDSGRATVVTTNDVAFARALRGTHLTLKDAQLRCTIGTGRAV